MCIRDRNNAEHTFFNCDRLATRRASLVSDIGRITPDNIVGAMVREEDTWSHVAHYAEDNLRVKKRYLDSLYNKSM